MERDDWFGEIGDDGWPKLMKAAQIGAVRFRPGVSAKAVVLFAQRNYEVQNELDTPEGREREREREERTKEFMAEIRKRYGH